MSEDQAILRLLKQNVIAEQSELLELLEREGAHFTQSTLSRRLRRLSVVKLDGRYQHVDSPRDSGPAVLVEAVPPNLLVVKVAPGMAQAVALRLDAAAFPGVAGTVAGDDTILVVVRPSQRLETTRLEVEAFLTHSG